MFRRCVSNENLFYFAEVNDVVRNFSVCEWNIVNVKALINASLLSSEGLKYDDLETGAYIKKIADSPEEILPQTVKVNCVISNSEAVQDLKISFLPNIIKYNYNFSNKNATTSDSIEVLILQDADRLDAIGAVGIVRAFMYGRAHSIPDFEHSEPFYNFDTLQKKKETSTTSYL